MRSLNESAPPQSSSTKWLKQTCPCIASLSEGSGWGSGIGPVTMSFSREYVAGPPVPHTENVCLLCSRGLLLPAIIWVALSSLASRSSPRNWMVLNTTGYFHAPASSSTFAARPLFFQLDCSHWVT